MAFAYCLYHKRYMNIKEVKEKKCRCKANTKRPCKYYVFCAKQKYVNNIGKKGGQLIGFKS